jgi:hypothetical protein
VGACATARGDLNWRTTRGLRQRLDQLRAALVTAMQARHAGYGDEEEALLGRAGRPCPPAPSARRLQGAHLDSRLGPRTADVLENSRVAGQLAVLTGFRLTCQRRSYAGTCCAVEARSAQSRGETACRDAVPHAQAQPRPAE